MSRYLITPIILIAGSSYGLEPSDLKQIGTEKEAQAYYKMLEEWNKDHPGIPPPLSKKEEYEFFVKKGLSIPNSGVHVMPAREMYPEKRHLVSSINARSSDFKKKGYIAAQNKSATMLLSFQKIAQADYEHNKAKLKPQSTHLRRKLSDLKIAYDYRGVPDSLTKEVIGFAPENTFIPNGWTGAVEFFSPQKMNAICCYHETNIQLTGSSANLAKEIISKDVNGKVTIVEVSGTDASGYAYDIEWWDETYRHVLVCASKKFNPIMTKQTIALAIDIDNR